MQVLQAIEQACKRFRQIDKIPENSSDLVSYHERDRYSYNTDSGVETREPERL